MRRSSVAQISFLIFTSGLITACAENLGPGQVEDADSASVLTQPAPAPLPMPVNAPNPSPSPAPSPAPMPIPAADYQISSIVLAPAMAIAGSAVAVSANVFVKNGGSNMAVLFQIIDANYNQVALVTFEGQAFTAGQTRGFQTSLPLPAALPLGTYYLSVGLFNANYSVIHDYKNRALEVQVIP